MRQRGLVILLSVVLLLASSQYLPAAENDTPIRDHTIVPEDYFDIASLGSVTLSPKGDLAAYVESRWGEGKEGRQRDLWCLDIETRQRTRLTFDAFGAGNPVWSPDGEWVYFVGRDPHGGQETPPHDGSRQVWRVAPTGGALFPVTRVVDGIGAFELSPDGRQLYYTVAEQVYEEAWQDLRKEYADLEYGHGIADLDAVWRLDLEGWRDVEVLPAERVIHEMSLSPDGKLLAMITTADNETIVMEGWSRVDVLDLDSGELTVVTRDGWRTDHPSPFGWIEELAWSRDSAAVAFSVSYDGYAARIYVAESPATGWQLQLVPRPELVTFNGGLQWRGTGRTLCYRGERLGRIHVYVTEQVQGGKVRKTWNLTPGDVVVAGFSFSRNGKKTVAIIETTTHLNDIFTVKNQGEYEQLSNVNPQVDTWRLPRIEHISWTGANGDECFGILELPPDYRRGDGPLPLIVELHGGPTSSTKYRLRLWIYGRALMAANGYALFSPNYRGSTGYGDTFLEELIGRENDIEVTDILTGTHWLINEGIADPDRVGVMGWSNGGYLTNCLIVAEPTLFKAASSGAGVLDMVIQWGIEDTPGHVINYVEGLPWEKPNAYRHASPLYNLDQVTTPTLIHVGGNDPRVPPAHSRALYRALKHYLHVPVELVVYPGEPHGLTTHENRLAKMKWDLAWFARYLPTDDTADASAASGADTH